MFSVVDPLQVCLFVICIYTYAGDNVNKLVDTKQQKTTGLSKRILAVGYVCIHMWVCESCVCVQYTVPYSCMLFKFFYFTVFRAFR